MANCIVPNCHCTHYQQPSQDKGKILAYRPDCGCGHKRILHRLPTSTDTLILKELIIADSVPCCSLIPMSLLPSMTHFSSYDLIPIPADEIDNKMASQALCLCKGFCSDTASVLQQFSHSSFSDIHQSLPSVQCTRCKHQLLFHQKIHPTHSLSTRSLLSFKSSIHTGTTLTSPKLINLFNEGKHIGLVALVQCNSLYRLVCNERCIDITEDKKKRRSERLLTTASSNTVEEEQRTKEKDIFTDFLVDFLNTSFKNTTLTWGQELSHLEPTSLSSYWLTTPPTDPSPSRLMVAIGTAQNSVVIYNNVLSTSDTDHQIVHTTCPVTVVQYCQRNNGTLFLCIGDCIGTLQCTELKEGQYNGEEGSNVIVNDDNHRSSITDILWIPDKNYIITGNERGIIKLYKYPICSSNDNEFICCYKISLCSGPCTCLHWINDLQCVLVGSADNDIHILSMTSSINDEYNIGDNRVSSIMNYFTPVVMDKLHYCAVLKGHQSFVSGITGYHDNIVSIGLDGYTILWSYCDIERVIKRGMEKGKSRDVETKDTRPLLLGKKKGQQTTREESTKMIGRQQEVQELEPSFIYKLGTHEYLSHAPVCAWSIIDRGLLAAYQSTNRELSLSLY